MDGQKIRIHRIGSVTFGLVLIVTGVLSLGHLFLPKLDYRVIFGFWPLILITLGIEVLFGSRQKSYEIRDFEGRVLEQEKAVYDVPAILLTIALTVFAMFMGMMDWAFTHPCGIWY